jgi:outer membrane protein OmpA-like peptidoglycan-associated protein
MRRRRYDPPVPVRAGALAGVLALVLLAGCSSNSASTSPESQSPTSSAAPKPVKVGASVISTAGSTNEAAIAVPDAIAAEMAALGGKGSGAEWVGVAGDGTTKTEPIDLASDPTAAVSTLTEQMNGLQAQSPGRATLAGLDAVSSPKGSPVWVFSPLLDTQAPVDFRQLAFDESPPAVVKAVQKAKAVPDLTGRDVTFVVTPVAGQQKKLSKLQVGYLHAIWEGLATAGGAAKVTFFDGTGTGAGTGTIPAVPVPDPNDTINAQQQGAVRTCTLPSPALFVPDQPALIDKAATLKALGDCIGTLQPNTRITVEGHTAGTPDGDEAFAKDLSTRRATEVAALLRELKVPAKNIAEVVGYGSAKPIVQPASDPGNRAVVVTFSSPS